MAVIGRMRFLVLIVLCSFALMSCANFGGPALSVNGNEYSRTDMDAYMRSTVDFMNRQALAGTDEADADELGIELLDATMPADLSVAVTELIITNHLFEAIMADNGVEISGDDRIAAAGLVPFEGEPEGLLEELLLDFRVNEAALGRYLNQTGDSFEGALAAVDLDVDLDPKYGEWDSNLSVVIPPTGPGLARTVDVG